MEHDTRPAADPSPPTGEPPASKPLGQIALKGVIWTGAQTLGSKLATTLQQLIIAKFFLSEEDFGLVAMGQVVISLVGLGQSLGVGEILVRRHRHFDKWVHSAFWLNLAGGVAAMLIVWGIIPVWEDVFRGVSGLFGGLRTEPPGIQMLLAIWSLWLPLDSIQMVLNARMRVDMRFRLIAALGTVNALGLAALSIVLAWMGLGAYSLVIPLPLLSAATVLVSFAATRQRIRFAPQVRRWKFFLADSRYFLFTYVFNTFLHQGDYLVTGVFFDKGVLGAYYWAYRMSTQTAQFVGANLMSVLLPSYAKLDQDPARQYQAYKRTCATLLFIGMPLCFLQALVAAPLFHLFFGNKWDRSLPLFEVLSLAMAFTLPMTASTSLLLAQGRYRLNAAWTAVMSILFLATVVAGAAAGTVFHVALFVSLFFMVFGPLTVLLPVLRGGGSVVRFTLDAYLFPTVVSVLSLAAGWGLSQVVRGGDLVTLALRMAGWFVVCVLLVAVVRPQPARDLSIRLGPVLAKFLRGRGNQGETPGTGSAVKSR